MLEDKIAEEIFRVIIEPFGIEISSPSSKPTTMTALIEPSWN